MSNVAKTILSLVLGLSVATGLTAQSLEQLGQLVILITQSTPPIRAVQSKPICESSHYICLQIHYRSLATHSTGQVANTRR